jgi:hypothetical protein
MRSFIAACIGAVVGFIAVAIIALLDSMSGESKMPEGEPLFWLFASAWMAEGFAVIVICMYRISPWIARALRDEWESKRIANAGKMHVPWLERACALAIAVRRTAQTIDTGHISAGLFVALVVAALPFVLPKPKGKKA